MGWLDYFFPKKTYTTENFKAAGCIFTDGNLILAGYQPKILSISGIGGSRKEGETYKETALREMVEELFEIYPLKELLTKLETIDHQRVLVNGSYVCIIYSFTQLNEIISMIEQYYPDSKLYDKFPADFLDLIFTRKNIDSEVTTLALLPVIRSGVLSIDEHFIKDMIKL